MNTINSQIDPSVIAFALDKSYRSVLLTDVNPGEVVQGKHHENVGPITVSIGLGEMQPDEALADLIERADEALYNAKNSGRNQTQVSVFGKDALLNG